MQTDLSTITQGTLKTSRAWAQAFRDYSSSKGNFGNVDLLISGEKTILPIVWRDFLKSAPAIALLENPPSADSPWHDDTPIIDILPSEHTPIPSNPVPVPVPSNPVPVPVPSNPVPVPVPSNPVPVPVPSNPVPVPVPSNPVPVPVPVPSNPVPVPVPVPSNPVPVPVPHNDAGTALIQLIAQGLKDINHVAEQAITAQQVESIAESTAEKMIGQVIERLESEGRLSGSSNHVVRIQINDRPIKEVSGRLPKFFPQLLKLAQCNVPAFLVGPAGCGKTTAAEKLAEILDVPFTRVSLSAGVDEGILQGWLLPVGDSGRFSYVPAPMVTAYEQGGVVLLDELDSADSNMLIILSAVLDNSSWHIPLRYEQPAVVKHPKAYFLAAANTYGHGANMQFVGANQLDERTLSRLRQGQVSCDYDSDLEQEQFDAGIVEYGHMLRARCRAIPQFKRDISTRDIALNSEKATTCDHNGRPLYTTEQAWFNHFADWKADELSKVHVVRDTDMLTAILE